MFIAALALIAWFAYSYFMWVVPAKRVDVATLTPVDSEDVDDTAKLIERLDNELAQGE